MSIITCVLLDRRPRLMERCEKRILYLLLFGKRMEGGKLGHSWPRMSGEKERIPNISLCLRSIALRTCYCCCYFLGVYRTRPEGDFPRQNKETCTDYSFSLLYLTGYRATQHNRGGKKVDYIRPAVGLTPFFSFFLPDPAKREDDLQ